MVKKNQRKSTKSDATRATILAVARHQFGIHGFDRTTIREIAAGANIDPALVIRYFGSKDELFALAMEFDLKFPELGQVESNRVGEVLTRHYLSLWEGQHKTMGLPMLMRSAASNDVAAGKMRQIFARQVLPTIEQLSGKPGAAQRASLVATQFLGMAFCRYIIKIPPLVAMTQEELVRHIAPTVQRYIGGTI